MNKIDFEYTVEYMRQKQIQTSLCTVLYAVAGKGGKCVLTFSAANEKGVIFSDLHTDLAKIAKILIIQLPDIHEFKDVIKIAIQIIEAEKIPSAVWWGSSISGALTLYAGLKNPDKVSGMIVANSALPVPVARFATGFVLGLMKLCPERFLLFLLFKKIKKIGTDQNSTQFSNSLKKKDLLNWIGWAGQYHALSLKAFEPLQKMRKPMLIIECEDDPGVPKSARKKLKAFFSHAKVKTYEDGGHFPQVLHEDSYRKVIVNFLQKFG